MLLTSVGLPAVNFRGVPGNNEQVLRVRQVCDDVLGNAVGKAFPLWIVADVLERQHRDRSFFR